MSYKKNAQVEVLPLVHLRKKTPTWHFFCGWCNTGGKYIENASCEWVRPMGGWKSTTIFSIKNEKSWKTLLSWKSIRQLEPPLSLNSSFKTFRYFSALAPKFPINPLGGKANMGSLMHSSECGKATEASVTSFYPDLVAEIWKYWSRRLKLPLLVPYDSQV